MTFRQLIVDEKKELQATRYRDLRQQFAIAIAQSVFIANHTNKLVDKQTVDWIWDTATKLTESEPDIK